MQGKNHNESGENYVTVCPKCGSMNTSFEREPAYVVSGLSDQFRQCDNCGYHGQVFPQVPVSQVPKMTKSVKKTRGASLVQTAYGKGYYKFLKYIAVPLMILVILINIYVLYFK